MFENRTDVRCKHACVSEGVPLADDRGFHVLVESVDGYCELGFLVAPTLVFALQTEVYSDLACINAFSAELKFPVVSLLRPIVIDVIQGKWSFLRLHRSLVFLCNFILFCFCCILFFLCLL